MEEVLPLPTPGQEGQEEQEIEEEKMEDVLQRLGLSKFQEVFANEEIDLEVFKASSALELKTILNIPFGKIKMLKIEIEKNFEPEATKSGFLCPFCGKSFVSARAHSTKPWRRIWRAN